MDLQDAFILIGTVSVVIGFTLISLATGFIAAGAGFYVLAYLLKDESETL